MLGLGDLKQTRFYQDAFADGKQEGKEEGKQEGEQQAKVKAVQRMIRGGLNLETIAQFLDLPLEVVRQVTEETNRNES